MWYTEIDIYIYWIYALMWKYMNIDIVWHSLIFLSIHILYPAAGMELLCGAALGWQGLWPPGRGVQSSSTQCKPGFKCWFTTGTKDVKENILQWTKKGKVPKGEDLLQTYSCCTVTLSSAFRKPQLYSSKIDCILNWLFKMAVKADGFLRTLIVWSIKHFHDWFIFS